MFSVLQHLTFVSIFDQWTYLSLCLRDHKDNASPNVMNDAEKGELNLVTSQVHITRSMIPIKIFKVSERSFYRIANSTFLLIVLLLLSGKRTISSPLVQNTTVNPLLAQLALVIIIGIALVSENRPLISGNQTVPFFTIMNTGDSKSLLANNPRTLINPYMPFVTVIVLFPLLGVRGILFLLSSLANILSRGLNFLCLPLSTLCLLLCNRRSSLRLSGRLYQSGINQCPCGRSPRRRIRFLSSSALRMVSKILSKRPTLASLSRKRQIVEKSGISVSKLYSLRVNF